MYEIIVQRAVSGKAIPTAAKFKRWILAVLQGRIPSAEVTIRIVGVEEMTTLNFVYRQKNKPTNVLSFPFEAIPEIGLEMPILGDIVICAAVIAEEAREQQKKLEAHWAHIVVHGALHLLGYDHEKAVEAKRMESQEISILRYLGFDNPYTIIGNL